MFYQKFILVVSDSKEYVTEMRHLQFVALQLAALLMSEGDVYWKEPRSK